MIDARLAHAGHTGAPGRRYEVIPGLSLRFALAAIYDALSAGKTEQERYELDQRLGLEPDVEDILDERLSGDVPTSVADPAAAALLASFGEAETVSV